MSSLVCVFVWFVDFIVVVYDRRCYRLSSESQGENMLSSFSVDVSAGLENLPVLIETGERGEPAPNFQVLI